MKEAIGGIPIFQIVLLFILLFTGIMCLTINHSKAFAVKDEIINIIQNQPSINIEKIADYLKTSGYRTTGNCPNGNDWKGYTRDGGESLGGDAAFCIKENNVAASFKEDLETLCQEHGCYVASGGDYPEMVYYDVILFYQLDIPIISSIMQFKIYGSTKVLFG